METVGTSVLTTLPPRNDAKTVSIVALGCFHPVVKVQSASIHFFLGSEDEDEDSDDEDNVRSFVLMVAFHRALNVSNRDPTSDHSSTSGPSQRRLGVKKRNSRSI